MIELLGWSRPLPCRVPKQPPPRLVPPDRSPLPLRSIRPSLVDVRFTGDPWVVAQDDGTASLRLDNYRLARIQTSHLDLPSLNGLLLQLRHWQLRRRHAQQLGRCAR
jgi:hypothetical protein